MQERNENIVETFWWRHVFFIRGRGVPSLLRIEQFANPERAG